MHFSALVLSTVVALTSAVPVQDNDLKLVLQHDKTSNETSFALYSEDKSKVFAGACEPELTVGDVKIAMDVDGRGSGTLNIGDKSYRVVGDRKLSGGISCNKMYNDAEDIVECDVAWPGDTSKLEALEEGDLDECFSEDSVIGRRSLDLEARDPQGGCAYLVSYKTENVGDGNPHQNYLHKQVGPYQQCAERGSCFVGVGEEVTVSISAEIGFGGGPDGWITGGFGVERSKSESTERGCYGEPGDQVCQWVKIDHTAYTVTRTKITTHRSCGTTQEESDPYVIKSPNQGSGAVHWYCVLNHCRGDGDQYWEDGRAGGP